MSQLLHAHHGLPHRELGAAVQTMRRRGVRRENARLNTGRTLYAFNFLQRFVKTMVGSRTAEGLT